MEHIESMREPSSLLSRIEDASLELAVFLHLYGYDERPDIVKTDEVLIQAGVFVDFDAAAAKRALRKICEEEKENGRPKIAVTAMELWSRLNDIEKETMG